MSIFDEISNKTGLPKSDFLLDFDDLKLQTLISKSKTKLIYTINQVSTNNTYIAEIFNINMDDYSKFEEINLHKILQNQLKLDHISILKIKGFDIIDFNRKCNPVLFTEFAAKGSLSDLLYAKKKKSENISLFLPTKKLINILGIASGMEYLHSQNIIHCQLQTSSILLDDFYYPKISKFYNSQKMSEPSVLNKNDVFIEWPFVAPEIWESKSYSKASDVYAFSMIVYEIITNKKIKQKAKNLNKFINEVTNENYRPELPESIPKCYKDLIESCWSKYPQKRPSFSDIVKKLTSNPEFFSNEIDGAEYLRYIEIINPQINEDSDKLIEENVEKSLLNLSDYEKISLINYQYGYDLLCIKNIHTNEKFMALESSKKIDLNSCDDDLALEWNHEIIVMSKIDHPAIIDFKGYSPVNFLNHNYPVIVTEFAQNGSLMSILEMEKSGKIHNLLDDTKKIINLFGIASAMKYFHSKNIFFGFLFLDDILEDCYLYPKLINFSRTKDLNSDPWKSMIKDPTYYKKNDVFAFGIILYNFFSNDIYDVYTFTQFLPVFNSMIPKFYKDLIERCIDTDFENRPTFSEIVELLKTEEALTDKVNKKEFLNYINFIESGNKFLLKNISQIILNEEKEKEEIQYENNNNDFKVNPKFLLSLENYRILEVIGSGGFSHVSKIQNKISNEFYVAKISSAKIDDESDEIKLYTCREINILSELNHPALIKFLGFSKNDFEGNPCPTILMEYASNGSLDGMFKLVNSGLAPNEWTETKKLINIYGIASGMKYLHSLDIIHRDLKPANILLDDYLFPKLCDFGLSKDLNTTNHSQQGMKGTPLYMAPECLINEIYSKKNDVYSFAFIVYQFFSLEIPNQHKNIIQYFKMIERGERPRFDFDIPEFYKDLIERCWDQNPDFRPTFSQIVDLLESDDALTDTIDEIEFMNYVDFIKSNVFPPNKTNINDYVSYDKCPNSKIVNDFTYLQKLKFGTFTNLPVFKTFNKVKVNYDVIKKAKDIIISASIPKIDLDKYQREDYLGYGGFAKVYKITNKETKDIYAAKILNNETQDLDDEERLSVLREVTILPKMKYESIIKFIGYSLVNFQKAERPVFVTELAVNGSLGNVLQLERKGWTITGWNDTKKLINIYGIACGMEYLHYNTIIHRDLKPGNVLLNENLYPKITDFGFSRPFKHNCDQISEHASTVLGTLPYISPEIWDCYDHSSASDVYAFAMVVYEIITKEEPLKNFTNSFQIRNEVLRNQYRPTFENPIPNCYKKLIESCWCKDKLKRPTFTEIVYELKTNKEFITENIDMDEFVSYTKLLGEPYPLNKKDKLKLKKNMAKKEKKKIYIPSTIKEISELTISTFNRIIDTSKNEPLFGNCFLDLDQFEQIKLIMKNDLSKIFEVVKKDTRKKYSARVSNIDMNQFTEDEMIAIANEMKSISRISHPCILQFVGFSPKSFKNEPKPVIVNKLIKTKTLKEILSTVQQKGFVAGFDSTTKLKIIYGIASAIDRLHNDDILHRNLTPSNILLTKSFNPKISEFGLCTHLLIKSSVTFQSTRQFNGSPTYSAPEILNSSENTKKSDVYSFGLIVYEILTGEKPFNKIKSFSQFYEAVMRGYRPEFPDDMPEIYKRFIEYCWCQNPDERPQFVDIMNILKSDNAFFTDDINKSSFFKYVRKIDNYKDPDHHSSKHHKKNTL